MFIRLSSRCEAPDESTDESIVWPVSSAAPPFTLKQGQYLAFIYAYTRVLGRPPAEADMRRHFRVTPPTIHQMVLTLERAGLIRRRPGVARSIELLIDPEILPVLR
jgi:DNA-binding MarR family transcriptional regulator